MADAIMSVLLALCLCLVVSSVVSYYPASISHATSRFLDIISEYISMHVAQLWFMVLFCGPDACHYTIHIVMGSCVYHGSDFVPLC